MVAYFLYASSSPVLDLYVQRWNITLKVRIKMSVTGVEAQIARWKHRNYEGAEQHCKIKAPNERTEQQESDGDGDDMEADILQHAHV